MSRISRNTVSTTDIEIITTGQTRPLSRSSKRPALPLKLLNWLYGVGFTLYQNVITALVQIWANKGRAMLTTLGMIIAVTSTITVVSFVQGFGNYVTDMLRGFGTNLMFVVPTAPPALKAGVWVVSSWTSTTCVRLSRVATRSAGSAL